MYYYSTNTNTAVCRTHVAKKSWVHSLEMVRNSRIPVHESCSSICWIPGTQSAVCGFFRLRMTNWKQSAEQHASCMYFSRKISWNTVVRIRCAHWLHDHQYCTVFSGAEKHSLNFAALILQPKLSPNSRMHFSWLAENRNHESNFG